MSEYRYDFTVRYFEVDQQGVVFNAWYLAYLDEAMAGFLEHAGIGHRAMIEAGWDAQLVHTELDWTSGLKQGDRAQIRVGAGKIGTTSFRLVFEVLREDRPLCRASSVYVCIDTGGSGKIPVPDALRAALAPYAE